MVAELHKETALNRAAKYAGGPNEYDPIVFLSPVERLEYFAAAAAEEAFVEEASEELFSQMFGD